MSILFDYLNFIELKSFSMYYRNNSVLGAKLNLEIKSIEIPPNFNQLSRTQRRSRSSTYLRSFLHFYAILASKVVSSTTHSNFERTPPQARSDIQRAEEAAPQGGVQEEVGNVIEYICRGQRTIKGLCVYITIVAEIEELKKKKRLLR